MLKLILEIVGVWLLAGFVVGWFVCACIHAAGVPDVE